MAVEVAAARGLCDRRRRDVAAGERGSRPGALVVERHDHQRQRRDLTEPILSGQMSSAPAAIMPPEHAALT